jgi:tetratricopeptide (TPR) repeat protein
MDIEALKETENYLQILGFDPGPVDGVIDDETRDAIGRYHEFAFISGVEPEPSEALLRELRGVAGQVETLRAETKVQAEIEAEEAQDWLAAEARAKSQTGPAEADSEDAIDTASTTLAAAQVVPETPEPQISPLETEAGTLLADPDEAELAENLAEQEPDAAVVVEEPAPSVPDEETVLAADPAPEGIAVLVEESAPSAPPEEAVLVAEPNDVPPISSAEEVLATPSAGEDGESPNAQAPLAEVPPAEMQFAETPLPEIVDSEVAVAETLEVESADLPADATPAIALDDVGTIDEAPQWVPAETPATAADEDADAVSDAGVDVPPVADPVIVDAGVSNEELMPLPTETPSPGQEEAEEAVPAAAPGDDAGTSGEQLARLPAAGPAPAFDQSPSALYSRGMDLFRTGDYQSAIAFFNDALLQDPNFSAAYQLRGASYEAIGHLALALKDFDTLISLSPGSAAAYNNRCWVLARSRRLNDALTDCNKALSLNPYDSEALHSRGYVHEKMGQGERAKMDYARAYQLNPNDREITADARRFGIID